ncbi:MAG TPA: hypothetical protein VGJ63_10940 [Micromonosporaceae bacterium]
MDVRLTVAWTDPFGLVHEAGDVVDIDAVTLAELEEQGVVKDLEGEEPTQIGPGPGAPDPTADPDASPDIGPGPGAPDPSPDPDASPDIGPGPGGADPT